MSDVSSLPSFLIVMNQWWMCIFYILNLAGMQLVYAGSVSFRCNIKLCDRNKAAMIICSYRWPGTGDLLLSDKTLPFTRLLYRTMIVLWYEWHDFIL